VVKYCLVCRHFRLVLHKDTDVLSTDFKAIVINEHGRQQYVDVEGEFYHGFDECRWFSITVCVSYHCAC